MSCSSFTSSFLFFLLFVVFFLQLLVYFETHRKVFFFFFFSTRVKQRKIHKMRIRCKIVFVQRIKPREKKTGRREELLEMEK